MTRLRVSKPFARQTTNSYQKDFNPDKEDGTCSRCVQSPIFGHWQANDSSCLLWITADPGCGKSVLCKDLVDKSLFGLEPSDTILCYFSFKDTSPETQSPTYAVAAMLHQVLKSSSGRKAMRYALPVYLENKDKACENLEVMWKIIRNIAQDPECGRITFVLDALDEYEAAEQKTSIERLQSLERDENPQCAHQLKVLVTSRPYWNIKNAFRDIIESVPSIRLKGEKLSEELHWEMNHAVHARVSILGPQIAKQTTREELLHGMLATENRTYLWLDLNIQD